MFNDTEAELALGSFDEVGEFEPQYEVWAPRREPWLPALDVPQFQTNREPQRVVEERTAIRATESCG